MFYRKLIYVLFIQDIGPCKQARGSFGMGSLAACFYVWLFFFLSCYLAEDRDPHFNTLDEPDASTPRGHALHGDRKNQWYFISLSQQWSSFTYPAFYLDELNKIRNICNFPSFHRHKSASSKGENNQNKTKTTQTKKELHVPWMYFLVSTKDKLEKPHDDSHGRKTLFVYILQLPVLQEGRSDETLANPYRRETSRMSRLSILVFWQVNAQETQLDSQWRKTLCVFPVQFYILPTINYEKPHDAPYWWKAVLVQLLQLFQLKDGRVKEPYEDSHPRKAFFV